MKSKEKKNEFVTYWENEIRAGEKYMKKYSTQTKWKEWRQHYRGDWGSEVVPVNRIFSFGRTLIPRTYFRNPRVCVTAARPEYVKHALVVEAIDNLLIQELNLKGTLKRALLQSFFSGTAPIKLGFDSEFGYLPEQSLDDDSSTITQIGRKEGLNIEYNVNVKPGMPWALSAMPEDVIIPWGYTNPENLPWVAQRILRPLEDIKEDQKYKNTKDLQGTKRASTEIKPQSAFERETDKLFAELWEIRDFRSKDIIVISEGQILLKSDDILQEGGLPWEFLTINEDPEFFWGIPDVYILSPQQQELNDVKTQQSKHRKIALLKFLYQKNSITEEQLEHFLSGNVGPAVGIDAENIANAIVALQPHMPQELWKEAQIILADMTQSVGFSENQAGGYNPKGGNVTATETAEIAQGVDIRMDERKDILSDTMINIVKKWNTMIFNLWNEKRVMEIVGPYGDTEWVEFTGRDISCDYKLKIDPDTGFPLTSNAKRQLADGLMAVYNGDPLVDQFKLRLFHLERYENLIPGVTSLLTNPMMQDEQSQMANLLGAARQPSPMGSGSQTAGSPKGSNQGGGKRPISFDEFASSKRQE